MNTAQKQTELEEASKILCMCRKRESKPPLLRTGLDVSIFSQRDTGKSIMRKITLTVTNNAIEFEEKLLMVWCVW